MSRLTVESRLPMPGTPDYEGRLNTALYKLLGEIIQQLNLISEGRIQATTNATTAAPTTGKHQRGDIVVNTAPEELGSAGSKYIISHFLCVAAGEPGTWREARVLTGN